MDKAVQEIEETTMLEANIKEHPVVNVTVFTDRAEVSRIVKMKPTKGPGGYTLQVKGLVEAADPDSIRVKAESSKCEILEVTFGVHHEAKPKEESPEVIEAKALVEQREIRLNEKRLELDRVKQRDSLVQGFMAKELTGSKEKKEEDHSTSKVETVRELLAFHEEHSGVTDSKMITIRKEVEVCERELRQAKDALSLCRKNANNNNDQTSRDVSIIFNAPSDDEVVLRLTYNVSKASWIPSYDVRVSESNGSQAMQLSYFGVVKQSTGEDWVNAQLNLSTATPSIGGTPPAPPTKVVGFKKYHGYNSYSKSSNVQQQQVQFQQASMPQQAMIPMQSNMRFERAPRMPPAAGGYRNRSRSESDDSADSLSADEARYADEALRDDGDVLPQAAVSESGGGSSTFRIERKTTINSDNKDHKVCISVIELLPQFRYFATPALEAKAYLQVRAVNKSMYSLLASNKVAVFFDGSFVCNTDLKNIQPGESFSVFLGSDVTVKVEHKLVKKSSNEGKEGTFMAKKVDSREDYEYLTLLHNTKNRDIEITIVQLFPRSDDEKIIVDLIVPAPSTLKDSSSSTGAGQLKQDSVMKNKITNNIVFAKKLKPQEKMEIPFSYSIQWPFDQNIEVK